MDHNVPRSITNGLVLRGVDVIAAFDDDMHTVNNATLLRRATKLDRVLFTFDDDLLGEATASLANKVSFTGVIYAHQLRISIGQCIHDLELIAKAGEPEDLTDTVLFLPL